MQNEKSSSCPAHQAENWALAVNPATPAQLLDGLTDAAPPAMLERIAENPNASMALLSRLAHDDCPQVRAAVAENANTPQQLVFDLAQDESLDVRYGIAENPHMPLVVLDMLAHDENPYVAHRARLTIQRVQFVPRAPHNLQEHYDDQTTVLKEGLG